MALPRTLIGLKWAKHSQNPWPMRHLRGSRKAGLDFESKVCSTYGLKRGLWFEFEDKNGRGFCSPDGLLAVSGGILVVECKLTFTPTAFDQIQHLYRPVVEMALRKPTFALVVAQNLTPKALKFHICTTWEAALERSLSDLPAVLHLPRSTLRVSPKTPHSRSQRPPIQ